MKQVRQLVLFMMCLTTLCYQGCTSLDEVHERLDQLESVVDALRQAYDNGKIVKAVNPLDEGAGGWVVTFSDDTAIILRNGADGADGDAFFEKVEVLDGFVTFYMVDGRSFKFAMISDEVIPRLQNLSFFASANSRDLVEDVHSTIVGDSVVECWVPHIMGGKLLVPHIQYEGSRLSADGAEVMSDVTRIDFTKPVKLTVSTDERSKEYTVYVHAFTGLPVLWISTEDEAPITSKEVYLNAHIKLVEDVVTRAAGDVVEADVQIRGRGNTTWGSPKKPYRLKFDSKISLLDEPKDKSWVLLANYTDKTLLRNATAFYMSSISNLDYTPRFHFVEMMLNGQYNGTYQLGDKLKIGKNRVNVGDDGFLLEIDAKAASDDVVFQVPHMFQPVNIKEPDVEYNDANFNYVRDYLLAADVALFADNFTDTENGWKKYMDMDSFVDWYLVNEISKNNDACFFSSCWMNLNRGGKLKMGPVWDFDIAFGNVNYNGNQVSDGFWIKYVPWYSRLFQDPDFVSRVKERFNYFYDRRDDVMNFINENAQYLRLSVVENNNKWGTFYNETWNSHDVWGNYQNEVQFMKNWINQRFEWLKTEFDKL